MNTGDRLAAIKARAGESKREAMAERAAENRRRMPVVTAAVDQYREVFGDVRVAWASEGGVTIGSPSPGGIKLSETMVGPWNRKKVEKKR